MFMNIEIPFTPELLKWESVIRSEEFDFSSDRVALDLFLTGHYTRIEVGEIMTVARQLGYLNPETKYRDDKSNFKYGIGHGAKLLADGFKKGYKIGLNGKVVLFRESVSVPKVEDQDIEEKYIPTKSEQSIKAAKDYIFSKIRGNLINYLAIIAINDGDLDEVAKDIKKMVDEIVEKLK